MTDGMAMAAALVAALPDPRAEVEYTGYDAKALGLGRDHESGDCPARLGRPA